MIMTSSDNGHRTILGARKLACSKEVDGCARCKREGIHCNYSVQKPMGRPRKRPRGDIEAEAKAAMSKGQNQQSVQQVQESHHIPFEPPQGPELDLNNFDFDFTFDPTVGMDLDLSFLDMSNPNLNFFDLVQTEDFPSSLSMPSNDYLSQQPSYISAPDPKYNTAVENSYAPQTTSWHAGGLFSIPIDFNPEPQPPPLPQAAEFSPEDAPAIITQAVSTESLEKTPGLSPDSSGSEPPEPEPRDFSPSSGSGPTLVPSDTQTHPTDCECFSKLYHALDSLKHLPTEFDSAMAVTRNAAKTAYQTVICPVCGDPPLDIHLKPNHDLTLPTEYWLRPFQNMMMLGALLPSLSNAYVRILKMVDDEAAQAEAQNRKVAFKLEGYGGVWGRAAEEHHCSVALSIEGVELDPAMWRMAARALLKFDVYGYSRVGELSIPGVDDERPFVQIGLKDIMNMMEQRSKRRHELLDRMVADGKLTLPPGNCPGAPGGMRANEEGKPQCMVIIDIAKKSMADLIIP